MNCDKGFSSQCCCNCQFQTAISKHPWNVGEAKGEIIDHFGYACTVFNAMDSKEPFTFFNSQHGCCELYNPKKNKTTLHKAECRDLSNSKFILP